MMNYLPKVFGTTLTDLLKNKMAKSRYDNYTKEQLLDKIKQIEKHRYGLVWEDKQEDVAEQCESELPVLHEDTAKEIFADGKKPNNILIEGDNYHALYTLNFTHKRKIDLIYIDPPYNTGNKSWKYNNDYVDKEDPFKHSKWLSFISKRLKLSKNLLKPSGIILITIDDYEIAPLTLLMNNIFGEQNHLGTIIIINKVEGRTDDKFIATAHEYMLVYGKNSTQSIINGITITDEEKYDKFPLKDEISYYRLKPLRRGGTNSRRVDRPNLFYPVYYEPLSKKISLEKFKGSFEILPIDSKGIERVWQWGKQTFAEGITTEIKIQENNNSPSGFEISRKVRERDLKKITSIWNSPKYNAAAHGTKLLETILQKNRAFEYPKSIYSVIDALKITTNKNSLVIDFFAGSGTTGHAILELNQQDGGNRQFILCTNNENKICEEVTYPRIKKVIEGYNGNKGIPANLKYFKTEFVPQVITDNDKRVLVNRSTELLCLAENTFEFVKQSKRKLEFAIYKNNKQFTAIIYDEDAIAKCKEELELLKPKKTVIYVFSYDHEYNVEDFEDLTIRFEVKPIPEAILNVYRKNAKLRKK